MSQDIQVGVIGAGRMGRIHAGNLANRIPAARLVSVADPMGQAAERCAAELRIPAAHTDHRKVLEDSGIEAVVICSSTDTHAQLIVEAAQAGKHIFCEKPIDFDLTRIDRALQAVDQAGVKLQIGFNRRFDPSFARVKDLVTSGKIGSPHVLRITSRDPAPPPLDYIEVSGGIFLDMTIHDFDMARFLMSEEVHEIYAAGGVRVDARIGDAGDIDTCVITLRFQGGALGTIDNSRQAVYGYDQRVEVFGSGGMVAVANNTPDTAVLSDSGGVHGPLPLHFYLERYADSYLEEMKAFLSSIQENKPTRVSGTDGRIAVIMGIAARESLRENRPVRLDDLMPAGRSPIRR